MLEAGAIVLIDARPKSTFDAGHIPGAISLPYSASQQEYDAFRDQFPTSTHLVTYCSSTSCSVSKKLAEKLISEFGYQNVEYMSGGYEEWQQAELGGASAVTTAPAPAPVAPTAPAPVIEPVVQTAFQAETSSPATQLPPILSTPTHWSDIKAQVASGQILLIDARPRAQYDAGHIPGAISLPFSGAGSEELDNFVKEHQPDQHVVIYCSSTSCSVSKRMADKLAKDHNFKRPPRAVFIGDGFGPCGGRKHISVAPWRPHCDPLFEQPNFSLAQLLVLGGHRQVCVFVANRAYQQALVGLTWNQRRPGVAAFQEPGARINEQIAAHPWRLMAVTLKAVVRQNWANLVFEKGGRWISGMQCGVWREHLDAQAYGCPEWRALVSHDDVVT